MQSITNYRLEEVTDDVTLGIGQKAYVNIPGINGYEFVIWHTGGHTCCQLLVNHGPSVDVMVIHPPALLNIQTAWEIYRRICDVES